MELMMSVNPRKCTCGVVFVRELVKYIIYTVLVRFMYHPCVPSYPPRLLSAQGRSLATNVFMPATFAHLDIAEQAPVVNAFTTNGFIIRGNRVYGSVALLPRGLFHWKVTATLISRDNPTF